MFGRDEKVSAIRLTAAQYAILAIFLVLAYGLWRLQVMQSGYYASAAEKKTACRDGADSRAPGGRFWTAKGASSSTNLPSFSALVLRDTSRDLNVDADSDCARAASGCGRCADAHPPFRCHAQYQPIFLKEDITPDEAGLHRSASHELPELDTIRADRRLYPRNGFMAHLIGYVGESDGRHAQPAAVRAFITRAMWWEFPASSGNNDALMGKNGARQELVNSPWPRSGAARRNGSKSPENR